MSTSRCKEQTNTDYVLSSNQYFPHTMPLRSHSRSTKVKKKKSVSTAISAEMDGSSCKLSGAHWRRDGKMKESLQLRLWNFSNSPVAPGRLRCQISANQHEAETSIWHLKSAFGIDVFDADMQIPETKLSALIPFPAPPPERPGELARRPEMQFIFQYLSHTTNTRGLHLS